MGLDDFGDSLFYKAADSDHQVLRIIRLDLQVGLRRGSLEDLINVRHEPLGGPALSVNVR